MPKGADTQVDQSICFFAILIENLPALIEKSPKIFNPKLKDYVFSSVSTWTQAGESGACRRWTNYAEDGPAMKGWDDK